MAAKNGSSQFIKMGEVRARYGVSHMWVERRLQEDPDFPKPGLVIGKRRFWRVKDLERWERKTAARGRAA